MDIFSKRPLFLALTLFVTVSLLCCNLNSKIKQILFWICLSATVLLFLAVILITIIRRFAPGLILRLFLCAVFCTLATVSSLCFFENTVYPLEHTETPVSIEGEIIKRNFSASYFSTYTARVQRLNGAKCDFKAILEFDAEPELTRGDVIRADALLHPFEDNINGYHARSANLSNGILICADVSSCVLLGNQSASFTYIFDILREKIASKIDGAYSEDTAALLKALVIGERDCLDDSVVRDFRRLGISHILAISGTHFTAFLGMAAFFMSFCRLNKKIIYALLIPLALFYMGLSGFSASVCRAGLMAILSYWSFLCGRSRDSYTALMIAVSAILLLRPFSVLSAGLWLSFAATFAILIVMDIFPKYKGKNRFFSVILIFALQLLITICVFFATLPITAVQFGEVSIMTPLANLLIVPLFTLFLYLVPVAVLVSDAALIQILINGASDFILGITKHLADRPGLLVSVSHDFIKIILSVSVIFVVILLTMRLQKKWLILFPLFAGLLASGIGIAIFGNTHANEIHCIYFTNTGSDGIVLTANGKSMYIDISNGASGTVNKAEYISKTAFCPELSGYMITHYHETHIGSFDKLARSAYIETLYLPIPKEETETVIMHALCDTAVNRGVSVKLFDYNVPETFGACEIILYPPQSIPRSSHPSVSLKLTYRNQSILYLGSAFNETTLDWSDQVQYADFVLLGQHSPIAKKAFFLHTNAFLVYGDAQIFALSKNTNPGFVLYESGKYEITLK